MKKQLDDIASLAGGTRNFESPPLHQWNPVLSGDIDIRIASQGQWFHDGVMIKRDSLVRLFASILRREEDGEYYLVTPVEKWRIKVDSHALAVVDVEIENPGADQIVHVVLNTDGRLQVGPEHRMFLDEACDGVAAVQVNHGLTALMTRPAWYRLVELAEEVDGTHSIRSQGVVYPLSVA